MSTKKIIGLVGSLVLLVAVAIGIIWAVVNFDKVTAGMSGAGLYTETDLNKAYEDGYQKALDNKKEYETMIDGYRDKVTELNDAISQLNSQVTSLTNNNRDLGLTISGLENQKTTLENTIASLTENNFSNDLVIIDLNAQISALQTQINLLTSSGNEKEAEIASLASQVISLQNIITQLQSTNDLNLFTISSLNAQITDLNNSINSMIALSGQNQNTITTLNSRINDLENSVSYYQQLLSAFQSEDKAVATFMFNGTVYNVQVVDRNSTVSVATPNSTEYVIFNGWSVNGITAVNLATYTVTENTTFTALITLKYDVRFIYEATELSKQIIIKGNSASPVTPASDIYKEFQGWSIDGNTIINIANYPITQSTTFYAVIAYKADAVFVVDGVTIDSQTIVVGSTAVVPNAPVKDGYVFKGWAVGGLTVNASTYSINANTTFTAVFNKLHTVSFSYDGAVINTQSVENNAYATSVFVSDTSYIIFNGWSVNGVTTVDINNYVITENTTFTALLIRKYDVRFMNETAIHASQIITENGYAATPTPPTKDIYRFIGWSLDGTNTVDVTTIKITSETTFTAIFQIMTVSFAADSWETIDLISKAGLARLYYKVGDEKTISLSTNEQVTFVILGFDHDDKSDGSGKAGISIGMKNLLTATAVMSIVNTQFTTNGGWSGSNIRTAILPAIFNTLPSALQAAIKEVNKQSTQGNVMTNIITTADKLFLFSDREISGTTATGLINEGNQYEYWVSKSVVERKKFLANGTGAGVNYWLRSGSGNAAHCSYVTGSDMAGVGGGIGGGSSAQSLGICFGFCI